MELVTGGIFDSGGDFRSQPLKSYVPDTKILKLLGLEKDKALELVSAYNGNFSSRKDLEGELLSELVPQENPKRFLLPVLSNFDGTVLRFAHKLFWNADLANLFFDPDKNFNREMLLLHEIIKKFASLKPLDNPKKKDFLRYCLDEAIMRIGTAYKYNDLSKDDLAEIEKKLFQLAKLSETHGEIVGIIHKKLMNLIKQSSSKKDELDKFLVTIQALRQASPSQASKEDVKSTASELEKMFSTILRQQSKSLAWNNPAQYISELFKTSQKSKKERIVYLENWYFNSIIPIETLERIQNINLKILDAIGNDVKDWGLDLGVYDDYILLLKKKLSSEHPTIREFDIYQHIKDFFKSGYESFGNYIKDEYQLISKLSPHLKPMFDSLDKIKEKAQYFKAKVFCFGFGNEIDEKTKEWLKINSKKFILGCLVPGEQFKDIAENTFTINHMVGLADYDSDYIEPSAILRTAALNLNKHKQNHSLGFNCKALKDLNDSFIQQSMYIDDDEKAFFEESLNNDMTIVTSEDDNDDNDSEEEVDLPSFSNRFDFDQAPELEPSFSSPSFMA